MDEHTEPTTGSDGEAPKTYTGIPAEELGSDVPFPRIGEPGSHGDAGTVIDNSQPQTGDTPAGEDHASPLRGDEQEGMSQNRVVGATDHDQHRAPRGEGYRAEIGDPEKPPQYSVFDGAGNESVVVVADDEEGTPRQGTGPDAASALADARDPETKIGRGLGPPT